LRFLDDSKTNDLSEVQVTSDTLKRQTELVEKQTKLLLPDVWELQQKQQEEERQLQIKQQEEEIERLKVTRLKELLHDRDRNISEMKKNKSDWQQKMSMRVLDSSTPAATKFVPVPPPTQQSRPRRRATLATPWRRSLGPCRRT
jgi:type III secretory pathway component EscV